MSKISVKICVGTTCFVQGGADLLTFNEFLDEELLSKCDIEGCTCLGECKKSASSDARPPFVSINGKIYDSVHPEKLSRLLREATNA